jgi:hypothetical protein
MTFSYRFLLIAALVVTCWGKPVYALDNNTRIAVRNLVNEGANDFDNGQFESALTKFMEALNTARVPTVAAWAAQSNEKLGHLVAAVDLYERALLMQPNDLWVDQVQQQSQQQARSALELLKARIPAITVQVTGAQPNGEPEIDIDGVIVPLFALSSNYPLDPGTHRIAAKQGQLTATQVITLAERERTLVTLSLRDSAPAMTTAVPLSGISPLKSSENTSVATNISFVPNAPRVSNWQRTVGWVEVGVGAAGIVLGMTTGLIACVKRSRLHDDGCVGNTCHGSRYNDRVDTYNDLRTASTLGFVIGSVAGVTGLTLLLTSAKHAEKPRASFSVTPGQLAFFASY